MINPIRVSTYYSNYKPAFKSDCCDGDNSYNYCDNSSNDCDEVEETFSIYTDKAKNSPLLFCGILAAIGLGILAADYVDETRNKTKEINEKDKVEVLNKLLEIQKSKDIRKDTFTIKDMNDDKAPDIVLYKKDGSEVVFDMKNNKVLNSKTVTTKEYIQAE